MTETQIKATTIEVNGISYDLPPAPIAVICLDGSADAYLDAALARDAMPNLKKISITGYRGQARGALPSFTNVNNASIVTGCPPSTHGICGNFFLNPDTGEEVMMNSASFLRSATIMSAAAKAGRKVGVVTAKEKLRDIFAHELEGIAFSTEKANQSTMEKHGIDDVEALVGKETPYIYSGEASVYVLEAGVALLESGRSDFLYLSTTDYMQHTYEPDAPESIEFYHQLDKAMGRLLELGARIGITADHGMNAKQGPDGSPNVIYLETELSKRFGDGFSVILPITDPYVVHHGALGSFAVIHCPEAANKNQIAEWCASQKGVTEVYHKAEAASKLQLPEDRLGDIVVLSGRDIVLGRTPAHHDLTALKVGLRSHGGRYEEMVPFIFSAPLKPDFHQKGLGDPRNFEVFSYTINGLQD
ncbi:MAG: phosphonoacetate hydrolase [Limisphaerales bacterium]|nr:phosphonoacetate hydrolase [Pedosphaera sp.]MBL6844509.1 phosphonoacetate hydrolase [Verrucomicrobiae bacterium]HAQ99255.1 phosphonoacetate hydrolase [Verrucomicrobiales bacterium]HBP57534.1 phosphonoacetate hydrolase [Verrucomicrobiales bacterium]HCP38297.1 phosphonoacetate hydrolase [Verrucomicrobiales bacterium]|tara:strand:- start:34 stop:1284 length:1251 start_codon:yes stop_codon:yes gene_type:complete